MKTDNLFFGDYLPDLPKINNPGCPNVNNVLPGGGGYKSLNGLNIYSDALDARPQGAFSCLDKDGNVYNYAGNASKLYELSSGSWSDKSKPGGYTTATDEIWSFAKEGNVVVATNIFDAPQAITLGAANFADLGGSPPKARFAAFSNNHLLLANVNDSVDGAVPHRVWNSALGDHTGWTQGTNQCEYYTLLGNGGWIYGLVGGEYAVIFQEKSITRATYLGYGSIFQYDEIEGGRGTKASNSIVQIGHHIYYFADDGFRVFNGTNSTSIGKNKVNETIVNEVDQAYVHRISGQVDPTNSLIFWAYPGSGNVGGRPNRLAIYDYINDKWAAADMETELLHYALGEGYTLEQLDSFGTLETLEASLDSRIWTGGSTLLSAFDENFKMNFFTGSELTATFETSERQFNLGRKTRLCGVRSLVDGGTTTIKVKSRDNQADSVDTGSSISATSSGRYKVRNHSRYQSVEATVSGGFTDAVGVEVETKPGAKR
jgi:hypothetical protein